ncbi:hypothetical protein [Phaffia rhodozyma]|uniref:Uncharacterized protein n=1 Tax=Phaffia rhodozyma TaxID=264483 RepID=A0A0F7SKJ3_PHARH|nr:hypothetical protein [Phaffia rhodozyma]
MLGSDVGTSSDDEDDDIENDMIIDSNNNHSNKSQLSKEQAELHQIDLSRREETGIELKENPWTKAVSNYVTRESKDGLSSSMSQTGSDKDLQNAPLSAKKDSEKSNERKKNKKKNNSESSTKKVVFGKIPRNVQPTSAFPIVQGLYNQGHAKRFSKPQAVRPPRKNKLNRTNFAISRTTNAAATDRPRKKRSAFVPLRPSPSVERKPRASPSRTFPSQPQSFLSVQLETSPTSPKIISSSPCTRQALLRISQSDKVSKSSDKSPVKLQYLSTVSERVPADDYTSFVTSSGHHQEAWSAPPGTKSSRKKHNFLTDATSSEGRRDFASMPEPVKTMSIAGRKITLWEPPLLSPSS